MISSRFNTMKKYYILIFLFFVGIIWSGINPHDYFTWILEVFPTIIGLIYLIVSFKNFKFTYLTYFFILIHCYVLFVGGHYTYAEVPLFNWIKDIFDQSRNNYDKIGHFFQGFVPAMIVRELLLRKQIIKNKSWTSVITICICLTFSVLYEFLEWFVAIATGESAESFLGTQGYQWDTQSDMLYALIGAIFMVVLFSKTQDELIKKNDEKISV